MLNLWLVFSDKKECAGFSLIADYISINIEKNDCQRKTLLYEVYLVFGKSCLLFVDVAAHSKLDSKGQSQR